MDIPILTVAGAHRQILTGRGAFRQRALAGASRWITRLVLIVALVGLGFSVEGAIVGSIGASVVELCVARYFIRPPLFGRSGYSIRTLLSYSAPLLLASISLRLLESDLLLLKALGGSAEEAGFYVAARNLSLVPGLLGLSVSGPLLSTLTRLNREGNLDSARTIGRNSLRLVFAMCPLAAMTAGASTEILDVLFGVEFSAGGPVLARLIFAAVGMVLVSMSSAMLVAGSRPRLALAITGPLLPFAVFGHALLIPRFGAEGAASVTLFVAAVGAFVGLVAVRRVWLTTVRPLTLLRCSALCVFAYVCVQMIPSGVKPIPS